jgi:hypothetical protein
MDFTTQKKKEKGKIIWNTKLTPITTTIMQRDVVIQPSSTGIMLTISTTVTCTKSMTTMWMNALSRYPQKIQILAHPNTTVHHTIKIMCTVILAVMKKYHTVIILTTL